MTVISQLLAGLFISLLGILGGGALWFRRKAAQAEARAARASARAESAEAAKTEQASLATAKEQASVIADAALAASAAEHAHDSALVAEHQGALKAAVARRDVTSELNARINDGRL